MQLFHEPAVMPNPPRAKVVLQLERSVLYHFAVISNRVGGSVHAMCRERWGMSPPAWRVMAHVGELQPITAKQIGQRAAIDSVSLSRALAQLDALGFVERRIDAADRRRIILRLTPQGQAVYDTVAPFTVEAERTLLAALNAQERAALRDLTRRVWERSGQIFDGAQEDNAYQSK
jgi:DNA-binding MarR family transcriptional regulator